MNRPSPTPVQPQAHMAEWSPIASLAMYDWPELQAANDRLWSAIAGRLREAGVDAPGQLTRGPDLKAVWTSPALLLGQTCGYPLVTRLGAQVQLVATPRYNAPGCDGAFRSSAVVVGAGADFRRLSDLQGARCAMNDRESDSGMNLLRGAIAPLAGRKPFFSQVIVTGSHLASAEAVAAGEADVAALDAVSYAHLSRLRPALAQRLRVLEWTEQTAGLPLITAANTSATVLRILRQALAAVTLDPTLAEARETLLLKGFSVLRMRDYQQTLHVEKRARALRYPELK
jgi:ABC-type phosphate/phosphonate transport system substrate-binding protein